MPHISPITSVDHAPVSGRTLTGGYDGRVICWLDGREMWSAQFDDLVNDVRFSPDGATAAVAAADRFAFVLDVTDGSHVLALGPHGDDVNVVRWLPDSLGLVCVMDHLDPIVRVWTPSDGSWTERRLIGHDSGVFGAALDPHGTRVATAAEDGTARVWDLDTLEVTHVLKHPGDPEAIDWSPDGSLVATGCDDGVCRLWDPDTGEIVRTLDEANAAVRFVRFAADGSTLLVGAYDATMRVYDTTTWAVQSQLRHPTQWERAAVQAGDRVIIGSFGADPVVHPPTAGNTPAFTYGINFLAVDDGSVVVGRDDGSVIAVEPLAERSTAHRLLARHTSIVNGAAFSPDGRLVASTDYRGVIHVSARDGSSTVSFAAPEGGPINSVVWHPDGEVLFTASYDGIIRRWTIDGHQDQSWPAHRSPIKSLAFSQPCGLLIAGSSDGTLSAWADGDQAWRAEDSTLVLVNSVAADAVGVVVSASRDLQVRRWDAATGSIIEALPRVHHKSIKAIATTDDGTRLVSGSYDGTAVMWRHDDGRWSWKRLLHHGKPGVPAAGFGNATTASMVFTAGWDGSLAWWGLDGTLAGNVDLSGEP